MPKKDKRIDAYIAKAGNFAKPILRHVRAAAHAGCPDLEETLKWGHPTFMHHGIIGGMAAFKEHASLGFWKGSVILDQSGTRADEGFGSMGKLRSLDDLPTLKVLTGYFKKAAKLNEDGVTVTKPKKAPKPAPKTPAYFLAALKKNKRAIAAFEAFSPSMKREYIDWLEEAKTEATRDRRLETAVTWIGEGKQRNWKYQNC